MSTPRLSKSRLLVQQLFPSLDPSEAVRKYRQHRQNAAARGIEWEFTLETWCRKWVDSGKWDERRRGGYAMARHGDVGPYSPANVTIKPNGENIQEAWSTRPSTTRKRRPAGGGKGWRYRPDKSARHPYEVSAFSRYVGVYATEQEATRAYQLAIAGSSA